MNRRAWKLYRPRGGLQGMRFIFFDVETYPLRENDSVIEQGFDLLTANFCTWSNTRGLRVRERLHTDRREDFYLFFLDKLQEKKPLYLVSANIWFDVRNSGLISWFVNQGWELTHFYSKGMTFIMKLSRDSFTVYLLNIQQFIPGSVKKYGKLLGYEKLEIDLETAPKEERYKYCMRDTDIITWIFAGWLEFIRDHRLGAFRLTLPSQSFNGYKHRFMKRTIFLHHNEFVTRMERESYYGGRTEAFRMGKITGQRIYYLDINSAYPYVMRNFALPYRYFKTVELPDRMRLAWFLKTHFCLGYCAVDTPVPAYPKRVNNRLCFPVGRFRTWLTHPEIVHAWKHGRLRGVRWLAVYNRAVLFRDFVDYFYRLRNRYKEENNEVYQYLTKIFLNSLYGKFGSRADKIIREERVTEPGFAYQDIVDAESGLIYRELIFGRTRRIYLESAEESNQAMVAVAAGVTGYTRMLLWSYIETAGLENVLYCDTDSVIVTEDGYKKLEGKINPGALGALKLEGIYDRIEIQGAKDYRIGNRVVRKGVSEKAEEIAPGVYRQLHFPGFRSDTRRGIHRPYAILKVTKVLEREYKKGIIDKNGYVRPFRFSEF